MLYTYENFSNKSFDQKKVGGAYNMTNYFFVYTGYSLNCYFSVLAFIMLIFGMKILYCVLIMLSSFHYILNYITSFPTMRNKKYKTGVISSAINYCISTQ